MAKNNNLKALLRKLLEANLYPKVTNSSHLKSRGWKTFLLGSPIFTKELLVLGRVNKNHLKQNP